MKRPIESPLEVHGRSALLRERRAIVMLLALAALHTWLVWGYTGILWGEHGRWLHEISRFAAGETPYRQFDWRNPPFALWLVGGLVRGTGNSLAGITAATAAIYLLLIGAFALHLRRAMPDLVLAVGLPALLFAAAYAMRSGVAMPLGTYTVAGLVGFLFLQLTVILALAAAARPGALPPAIGAGFCAALTLLSRHEFGAAALYVVGASAVVLWRPSWRTIVAAGASLAGTLVVALVFAAARSGLQPIVYMLSGSGGALIPASALPSLERLTVEVAATAVVLFATVTSLWLCLAISDRVAARAASALALIFLAAAGVHLGMSVAIGADLIARGPEPFPTETQDVMWHAVRLGRGLTSSALGFFDRRIQAHLFPALLPPLLLATLLLRWQAWRDLALRNRIAVLLGLCLVLRLRSGFGGAEWYNVLVELPTTILFMRLAAHAEPKKAGRAARALMAIFILLGLYAYVSLGVGPLTLAGRLRLSRTAAGAVHWPAGEVGEFRRVDSILTGLDPQRRRAVFAFGTTGGWNYFLGRSNPTPWTEGIAGSLVPLDRVAATLRAARPAPFLLDNRYAQWPAVSPESNILQWDPDPVASPLASYDRAMFDRFREGCTAVGGADSTVHIIVYDCGAATAALPVSDAAVPPPAAIDSARGAPAAPAARRPGRSP